MKYFIDKNGELYVDPILKNHIEKELREVTAVEYDLYNKQNTNPFYSKNDAGVFVYEKDMHIQILLEKAGLVKTNSKNGGFLLDLGGTSTLFDSDNSAQTMYVTLQLQFAADPTKTIKDYKASTGHWVTMDAALFGRVAKALEEHYAKCFSWLRAKEKEIKACDTEGQLNAVSLVFGE